MADLSRRSNRTPRRAREKRAYQAVLVGGTAGAVAVVTFVLAIFGILSFGIPVLAAVIAALAAFLFQRTVK